MFIFCASLCNIFCHCSCHFHHPFQFFKFMTNYFAFLLRNEPLKKEQDAFLCIFKRRSQFSASWGRNIFNKALALGRIDPVLFILFTLFNINLIHLLKNMSLEKVIYYFAFKGQIKEKVQNDLLHCPFKPPDK